MSAVATPSLQWRLRLHRSGSSDGVPIVYSVSFSDPAGYFLAIRVQMHNKDVIFAANAQAVEITKFTTFLNTLLSVPINTTDLGINIETWRTLSKTR